MMDTDPELCGQLVNSERLKTDPGIIINALFRKMSFAAPSITRKFL